MLNGVEVRGGCASSKLTRNQQGDQEDTLEGSEVLGNLIWVDLELHIDVDFLKTSKEFSKPELFFQNGKCIMLFMRESKKRFLTSSKTLLK